MPHAAHTGRSLPASSPPPVPGWVLQMRSQVACGQSPTQITSCLLQRPDFAEGGPEATRRRADRVIAECRKRTDDMKAIFSDTSLAGLASRHQQEGTYINVGGWDPDKISREWAKITDETAALMVAIDAETGAFAITTKALVHHNLGGLLGQPQQERAAAIDATFNIARFATKIRI